MIVSDYYYVTDYPYKLNKYTRRRMIMRKLWKCSVCGYVHEGAEAPAICPKCGAPSEKFIEVPEDIAAKVYASDRTNDIHSELMGLSMKIAALADEGIAINLDPNCVSLFEKAKNSAWVIKQSCKAELLAHISKGKF
jgi:rubredoxin